MARTRDPHEAALKAWQTRKRAQQAFGHDGGVQAKGDWKKAEPPRPKWASLEGRMHDIPPKKAKFLGGGVSGAYKVTLQDDTEYNYKPGYNDRRHLRTGIRPGQNAERELAAWEVAKIVGLDDMVAPVTVREVKVPTDVLAAEGWDRLKTDKGSFAQWQDGDVAITQHRPRKYDGDEDLQRAAMYDFVIGNQDRHDGNWVINADGKLKLIDHGLSFGEKPRDGGRDDFRDEIFDLAQADHGTRWSPTENRFVRTPGTRLGTIAKFAEPYLKNKDAIIKRLREIGLPAAAIKRTKDRIERLATMTKWTELTSDPE